MKNTNLFVIGIVVLLLIGFWFVYTQGTNQTGNVTNENNNGNVQEITIGMKNSNYYPNTITVKQGSPVRIHLDSSVTGCLRSFTIREFGVSKNLRTPQDYVEFTPSKTGSFGFACVMGMGTGTLIVE